jgi:hypothetical protein
VIFSGVITSQNFFTLELMGISFSIYEFSSYEVFIERITFVNLGMGLLQNHTQAAETHQRVGVRDPIQLLCDIIF